MGCWNATCAISGLPIESGAPVYAAIVVVDEKPLSNCYPTSAAFPAAPMFQGLYDSYGAVSMDSSEAELARRLASRCLKQDLNVEKLTDLLARQEGSFKRYGQYPSHLDIWMAHEGIVDAIAKRRYHAYGYSSGRDVHMDQADFVRAAQLAAEHFHGLLISAFGEPKADLKAITADLVSIARFWERLSETRSAFETGQHMAIFARQFEGDANTKWVVTALNGLLQDMAEKQESLDELRTWFEALGRTAHMNKAMSVLRRSWLPPSGAGGQGTDYAEHAMLAEATRVLARELELE